MGGGGGSDLSANSFISRSLQCCTVNPDPKFFSHNFFYVREPMVLNLDLFLFLGVVFDKYLYYLGFLMLKNKI